MQSVNEHGALSPMSEPIDVATGVDNLSAEERSKAGKTIYNLLGQPVKTLGQGVYIVNRKAVTVR